jgi:hypothetical protein
MSKNKINFDILKEIVLINITILWLFCTIFYPYMGKPVDILVYKYITDFLFILICWNVLYSLYKTVKIQYHNFISIFIHFLCFSIPLITSFIIWLLIHDFFIFKTCKYSEKNSNNNIEMIEFCKEHLNSDISK